MKTLIATTILLFFILQVFAQPWMQYADPAQAGFDTTALNAVEEQFDDMHSTSFMVVHRGSVVLALGDVTRRYMCHSMRKSIMSAMIGMYAESGDINLYQTLADLGINDKQELSVREQQARVHDLITARSGVYHPAAYEPRSMAENRPERGSVLPGEKFFYNNWDFNALVTIFEMSTGKGFFEAVHEDLVEPLGMEDLRREDMHYRYDEASLHPAYLFKMSARDLARFGQLYLNRGKWRDTQILPKEWVARSTRSYTNDTFREGYGYLWWTDKSSFGEPCYYASGLGGHRVFVFPDSELVIVHQVNTYINQFESTANINELVKTTLSTLKSANEKTPTLVQAEFGNSPTETKMISSSRFSDYAGQYMHPFFGELKVTESEGVYVVKGNRLGSFRLIPKSEHEFALEDLPELPVVFEKAQEASQRGSSVTKLDSNRKPSLITFYY